MNRILLLAALLALTSLTAHAQVSIRVEQISDNDSGQGKQRWKNTQKRSLKVHLSNTSTADKAGLRVKYWFFAKDVKDRDTSVFKTGETTADVKAKATAVIESETVTSSYTEDHVEGYGKTKKGSNKQSLGKTVKGAGDRFSGYGVRVFEGDKMVAEYFSSQGLKESVGAK